MDTRTCSDCGESDVPGNATFCPSCGKSIGERTPVKVSSPLSATELVPGNASSIPLPQILGLAGSVILFIGVFTPIISLPIVGSMNYFQNGRGDGVIILLVAILSAFLTLAKRYRFLMYTGGGSLAILALTFIVFQVRMSQIQSEMKKSTENNPFAGLGDALMSTVQISWGWAVLIIGAVFLIAAALVHRRTEPIDEFETSVFPNITDKQVYISIAAVFAIWIGLIAYSFVGGGTALTKAPSTPMNPLLSTSTSNSFGSSTSSAEMSSEETEYLTNVAVSKVEIGKTILDEPGVFGELKNNGEKILDEVEITIYFLDAEGNPVSEKTYKPVNANAQNFGMSDTSALKPKYSRKFGYKADEAPSDWAKKVNVRVTGIRFSSLAVTTIPPETEVAPNSDVPTTASANTVLTSSPIKVNKQRSPGKKIATVIMENANVRTMPDIYGDVVGTLGEGEVVEVVKQRSGWYLIRYGRTSGWIHGNTIEMNN